MIPTMRHSLRAAAKGTALAAIFLQAVLSLSAGERLDLSKTIPKTEHFDTDPGWEGHNNRVAPKVVKTVQQDFGYRATNFAGKAKGEIGGTIWRSPTLASYAAKIPVKTLNDKLTASGTFALTASSGSSGVFFGWYSEKPGNSLTMYFDDLTYDGTAEAFSADAGWIGVGNQTSYQRREEGGAHDFGFSAQTSHAGGKAGELGGVIWRSGVYGYYADKVGPLSLTDRLEASGKVMLAVGPPDSGMYLGWFHSAHKENAPHQAGELVGVRIGGPTRIGHYFAPAYATAQAAPVEVSGRREHPARVSVESREGPVLVPRQVLPWKLVYDPDAAGGQGAIHATLGERVRHPSLKTGRQGEGRHVGPVRIVHNPRRRQFCPNLL